MTFLNVSLLAGAALIAVPIILHMMMRRKPTLIEFPALRFVQLKHEANKRRLKLRHLLLLLLRAAAIALLALALARPSVQFGGALGSQESPVAAALIFDAAPHMEYRRQNQTRLEAAKELGLWVLSQLPYESEIAVFDTRAGAGIFQIDRSAAQQRIKRLELVPNSQPLTSVVEEAVRLLKQSRLARKEIYIFSDLSRGGWPKSRIEQLQTRLKELPEVGVYVVDVGVSDPVNLALGEVRLSDAVLSNRGSLRIDTDLFCSGTSGEHTVELQLLDSDGKPMKRSQESVMLKSGESRHIEFRLGALDVGPMQGVLRIVGQDALDADDTRYFSVEVKPAWRVLLVAPKPPEYYAFYLAQALAPDNLRRRGQARFNYEITSLDDLPKKSLSNYSVVCLLDPTPLEPATWQKLTDYTAEGHGLAIFLGRNARPVDSFNSPQAQELLPGKLVRQALRPEEGDLHLNPLDMQHPVLAVFREQGGSVPWQMFQVYRYWQLEDVHSGVGMIVPYNDGRPAILERPVGSGRSITITTPVSDRPGRNPWNVLPIGEAGPFVILVNQMVSYLAGSCDEQLNYFSGQTAVLALDPNEQHSTYMLIAPGNENFPLSPDLERHRLTITNAEQPGNYRVRAGGLDVGFDRGFSVNLAPEQTQLERITEKELTEMFGEVKIRVAQAKEQIYRNIVMGRVGRELFPPLIFLVAVILAVECFISNRFYREAGR